ncbi:MAG TPA: PEP-CTERM sorting domain-containing protein [Opitutus sp.]|nr:PEP-CTERM sorting domain-containing protein [Opitutus sp.]
MRVTCRWGGLVGLLSWLVGNLSAQSVIHDIALANPTGIQVSVFLNGGSTNFASGPGAYQPDPENNPDYWLLSSYAQFGPSQIGSFSMTLDPIAGATFQLQIGNSGSDVIWNSDSFLVIVSGLEPANSNYNLSGVEFGASEPYVASEFDLEEFPDLSGNFGSFNLINAFTNGVLAIEVSGLGNFNFLSGTNILLTGTFDAIDAGAVPEPAMAALALAAGAAGFVAWRRRTSRAA